MSLSFFWGLIAALAGNSIIGLGNCLQKYALTRGAALSTSQIRQDSLSSRNDTTSPISGSYSRFKDRTWFLGISLVYLGELCGNWVALSLIPASVVTPLGILGVVVNAILAKFLLDERISFRQTKGYVWVLSGVFITILFSATAIDNVEDHLSTTLKLFTYMTRIHVILWLITVLVIQFILIMMVHTRKEKSSLVLYVIMTAGFGSLTVVASKFLALLLKVWVFDNKSKIETSVPMLAMILSLLMVIFVLIIGIVGQETCKQLALSKYRVTQFQPMFYASHVTLVALSGMIVFEEVGAWWSVVGFCFGIIAIIRGALFLLHPIVEEKIAKQIKKVKEKSLSWLYGRVDKKVQDYDNNGAIISEEITMPIETDPLFPEIRQNSIPRHYGTIA